MPDEWIDIEIDELVRVTPGAVLVQIGGKNTWIPKSVIEDVDLVIEPPWNEAQTIAVKRWFAKKEQIPTLEDDE